MTIPQAMQFAMQQHRAGQLQPAEAIYRHVLAAHPNHPDANHMLGILSLQSGNHAAAVELIQRGIAASSEPADMYCNLAIALHGLQRIDDAIRAVQKAASLKPKNPDFQGNLGSLLQQARQHEQAAIHLRRAAELRPSPQAFYDLAIALAAARRFSDAEAAYRKATSLNPNFAEAWNNLGVTLQSQSRLPEAIAACIRAVSISPCTIEFRYNLAVALQTDGQLRPAIAEYSTLLAARPDHAATLNNLGEALRLTNQLDDAHAILGQLLSLQPDLPSAWFNLGNVLRDKKDPVGAIGAYQRALSLQPDYPEAGNNLAHLLLETDAIEQARQTIGQVLAAHAEFPEAWLTLGTIQHQQRQIDDAIASYERTIARAPEHASAHHNLGIALLLSGNLQRGWAEFDWRFKVFGKGLTHHTFKQPRWDGSDPAGKRILLYAEQGFGDTIQFSRCASLLARRGARVILAVQPELRRLLAGLSDVEQVVALTDSMPQFDLHCPLMSTPRYLGIDDAASIPSMPAYLQSDSAQSAVWKHRLEDARSPRIGLAWAGSAEHRNDRHRSISLNKLAAAFAELDATFISLQNGPAAAQLQKLKVELPLKDFSDALPDFSDTAALMNNLDLIITVDTAIAHLAGAMGKLVWVLLPWIPDWRWMLDRTDSPWYPTMKLYRQPTRGDYHSPLLQIKSDLKDLLQRNS